MPPVFGHGRLRLYLLKLLAEAPRHGYELIRLLEERFDGHYAPSAGTVYPRLAKLETEGLISHTLEGGRKVYAINAAGRAELASRQGELTALEAEIADSLAALATDIQRDVSGSARSLRDELHQEAPAARTGRPDRGPQASGRASATAGRDQARRARHHAQRAQARAEEAGRRAWEGAQHHEVPAAWASALAQTMDELGRGLADWSRNLAPSGTGDDGSPSPRKGTAQAPPGDATPAGTGEPADATGPQDAPGPRDATGPQDSPGPRHRAGGVGQGAAAPGEANRAASADDPRRELERLLDQLRDEVRDAARDHGVSPAQLRVARRHLSTASAHLGALLRTPDSYRDGTGER